MVQKSPMYPNFSLRQAVTRVEKIFKEDRRAPMDRAVAVRHMGFSGPSGAADKALGTMAQYGLVERVAKGELKVTQRAVDILHPNSPSQRPEALAAAAFAPPLFKALQQRFPDGVSGENLKSYLVRENFLDRAINPILTSYMDTLAFLKQEGATESGSAASEKGEESATDETDDPPKVFGGARIGDLIQWESQGVLQLPQAARVRLVTEDGAWVAVEGSETGIPMNEVIVEHRGHAAPPPQFALPEVRQEKVEPGETEWMRLRTGADTKVRLLVSGEMGSREIKKLIKLLEAQRAVLDDDDD